MKSLGIFACLMVGFTACGGGAKTDDSTHQKPQISMSPVPSLAPQVKAGPPRTVDVEALRTMLSQATPQARVYNFWATWCGPCMAELPLLRSFQVAHPNIQVVMVNVDSRSLHNTRVKPAILENALQDMQHILIDTEAPNRFLTEAVPNWPSAIPVTLVVDHTGREVSRFVESLTTQALEEAILRASAD